MYGPPSSGQQMRCGISSRSTWSPWSTTAWQGTGPEARLGGNFASSASFGSIESFPAMPSGTSTFRSSVIRAPVASREGVSRAIAIRFREPKRLMATGIRLGAPPRSTGRSNRSAGPPPGLFMHRSAISVISRSTETGSLTRTSSPASSSAATKSRRLSRLIGYPSGGRRCRP